MTELFSAIPATADYSRHLFETAFHTRSAIQFMDLVFPPEWKPITARIIESGVTMSAKPVPWAPRWTPVSPTIRVWKAGDGPADAATEAFVMHVKSCIYRAHDLLHQLWGLPIPSPEFSFRDSHILKRAQMCGEVAVLTLTEFLLAQWIRQRHPVTHSIIVHRNAYSMLLRPLQGRTIEQIAMRLDGLLHKKIRPHWVREDPASTAFCDDYVPMLERDRELVDHNWAIMKALRWRPEGAPNTRYSRNTDGLELTTWMIRDFFQLLQTDDVIDEELAEFNRERRSKIVLPAGWNELPQA